MLTRSDQNNTIADENADPNNAGQGDSADRPKSSQKKSVISNVLRGTIQIVLMVAVLAGSFMAMSKLMESKPEIRKHPRFRTVYTVETTPVELANHRPTYTVYGQTVASRNVDLRSLVSGEVISVNPGLKAGAPVTKGDALVEIDGFNFQGALREAQANRDEALARIKENQSRISIETSKISRLNEQLALATSDHKRIADLRARGTTTQKQLDERSMALSQRAQAAEQAELNLEAEMAKLEQQKASLARLDWRVQLAERNLSNTVLKAPFNGIVRSTGVEIGKTVNANDVVVSIYEKEKIDIRFTLTDDRYGRLQADQDGLFGRKMEIIWAIGGREYSYPAIIDRAGAEISSSRGGVEVFATLQHVAGNPAIRPGAFVEIRVPDVQFVNSTIVPETAIYNGERVYINDGGKLISKKIEVLAYDHGNTIIAGDLADGDRILTTRIAEISDGLKVREEGQVGNGQRQGAKGADGAKGAGSKDGKAAKRGKDGKRRKDSAQAGNGS